MGPVRSTSYENVRKSSRSLKSFMCKIIAFAMRSCVGLNHSEDAKLSPKVKKQDQKCASIRNSKPSSLSTDATLHGDVESISTTNRRSHTSSSGHESSPTPKEDSTFDVNTKQAEDLFSSLQVEPFLHGNDNVYGSIDISHGQNPSPAVMESDDGASATASLITTPSALTPSKPIKTNRESSKVSSSTGSTHFETTFSNTTRPRENRVSSHLCSSEPTDENLTAKSLTDQSTIETVPHCGSLSHENLGIITGHPEKPEFAIADSRRRSFEGWPSEHHLKPDDLAEAGFYYAGYSDSARCFYCNGGLRHWEEGDDVWVEHARWYPQCEFLRQTVGCAFIEVVGELKKEQRVITHEDVLTKLKTRGLKDSIPKDVKNNPSDLEQNIAIKTMIDAGFPRDQVLKAACRLQQTDQTLAGDLLYEEMFKQEAMRRPEDTIENVNDLTNVQDMKNVQQEQETIESLKNEIAQLRQVGTCKICMDKKVSVVFLPCGHLISCQDCSYALKSCPICRNGIKGIVRAYLS